VNDIFFIHRNHFCYLCFLCLLFFFLFPLDLSYVHVEIKFEKTFLFISLVWNYILLTCCYWDTKKLLALRLSTLIDGQFSLKKLLSFKDEYTSTFFKFNFFILLMVISLRSILNFHHLCCGATSNDLLLVCPERYCWERKMFGV
jgi:hypothetical protein